METLRKCIVTHFEARGPRGPLEGWRCAAVGAIGALWNRGDAFWGLEARKFSRAPQGTQGIGDTSIWRTEDCDDDSRRTKTC